MREINRGYLEFIRGIPRGAPASTAGPGLRRRARCAAAYLLFVAYSVLLKGILGAYLLCSGKRPRYDPESASLFVDTFADQYPFHLYPLLAKSLELYFLREKLKVPAEEHVLDVGIGEGSFSRRLFEGSGASVYAFDLNPYSLDKADFSNVKRKVVADCVRIPVAENIGMTILGNNLVHHVSDKGALLRWWAGKASRIVFNENTPHWATGETIAYLAKTFGFAAASNRRASRLAERSLQHLLDAQALDRLVASHVRVERRLAFYDELTHFLAMNYSFIYSLLVQECVGPPTPLSFREMANRRGILGRIMLALTRSVARSLIRLDSILEGGKDVFVYYDCRGRGEGVEGSVEFRLSCPECEGPIEGNRCRGCDREYPVKNRMLFLLGKDEEDIAANFDEAAAARTERDHL